MSVMANDLVGFKSLLQLGVEFLKSRDRLVKLKVRQKKHLIGTMFPTSDMIFAAGAYPVFPVRMQKFGDDPYINALDIATKSFGWSPLMGALGFLKKLDNQDMIASIMDNIIEKINHEYNRLYDLAEEMGIPADSCYGIKALYGMYAEKGKNLSGTFNSIIRCSTFTKYYESTGRFTPSLWLDVPMRDTEKGREMLISEIHRLADELGNITGINVTNSSLRKSIEITNECKEYSKKIIYDIALGDVYPCNPVTLGEFLALIEISFQDYLSNAELFRDILKEIYREMNDRKRKSEFAIDVSKMPKVLLVPRFGGWDTESQTYVYEGGGRLFYADWEIFGYLDKVKTSGDMFENYADYIMGTISGFGVTNEENASKVHKFVTDNNVDAVVYNQLFGCHSLTTTYRDLRKKLIRDEIPSTVVTFNKIGENRQQLKTRIEALMELLK